MKIYSLKWELQQIKELQETANDLLQKAADYRKKMFFLSHFLFCFWDFNNFDIVPFMQPAFSLPSTVWHNADEVKIQEEINGCVVVW